MDENPMHDAKGSSWFHGPHPKHTTTMNKVPPIGIQDFKKVRDGGYLYVDKSDMIPQILSRGSGAYLFTRPGCFGKSLNLSMLDAFFNIRYPRDNTWFDGLKVSEHRECDGHRNSYPVIKCDLKDLDARDYDLFLSMLSNRISELYKGFDFLLTSERINRVQRSRFGKLHDGTKDESLLMASLSLLSKMLHVHYDKTVIILVDEYDNPIHNAYGNPHHQEILDMIWGMLSSALKGNESLAFGVVTGVMQIAEESIFSGLNNFRVNNVLSKDFDEMFGFTSDEVRAICEEYGHPEKFEEAREWYDGYRFGDAEVYNPWSLLNYVGEGFEPKPYWAGTSRKSILREMFESATPEMWDEFSTLAEGKPIMHRIKPTVMFQDLRADRRNVYSMLVMSGHLTAELSDDGRSFVRIPNGEMANVFGSNIPDMPDSGCLKG